MTLELVVERRVLGVAATLGSFFANGQHICDTLEDTDRGLDSTSMPESVIRQIKVYGRTAIPYGRYRVVMKPSVHFGKLMPHLIGVPGFDDIMIHPGNRPNDTLGCILVGWMKGEAFIGNSKDTFYDIVLPQIVRALDAHDEVWITIRKFDIDKLIVGLAA